MTFKKKKILLWFSSWKYFFFKFKWKEWIPKYLQQVGRLLHSGKPENIYFCSFITYIVVNTKIVIKQIITLKIKTQKTFSLTICSIQDLRARDKIYTGVRREPDGGKLSSAVGGPDVCRWRARHLLSTGQIDKIPKGSPTSAVDGPDVCRQQARQTKFSKVARRLPSTGPTNTLKQCLLSTGPTNKLKQYLLLTGQTSAVNLSKGLVRLV
jgi:hypothetical protein